MTFPVYIEIGSFRLLLHAVLELAAFFIGFRYFLWLRKKRGDGIETSNRTWIIVAAIVGALLGSRLIGGLEHPEHLKNANNFLYYFYQNKTVLGGFLGGLAGVELVKKIIGETRASGDLFVFPILLALIIGRLGCFSMGVYEETFGTETTWPIGMDLGDGLLRHPVSLYEIAFLLVLWLCLSSIRRRFSLREGALFKLFMIAYLVFRIMLDFIKPHYTFSIGLSTIQLTCIAGLLYYSRYIAHPKKLLASSHA